MTGTKCLLDTSAVIHIFKQDKVMARRLDQIETVYISPVVIGELLYGAYVSANPAKHIAQIQDFLMNCKTVVADVETSDVYGIVKAALKKKGKPIPENDIWIAATAIRYDLPLFSTDNHFDYIEQLVMLK